MSIKYRLIVMNFLQFAVWGAYLTSMSRYLGPVGMGAHIDGMATGAPAAGAVGRRRIAQPGAHQRKGQRRLP